MILQRFKSLNWGLIALVFLIVTLGLMIHYGLSLGVTQKGLSNFTKQILFALIGFFLIFIISQLDFRLLKSFAYLIYLITLIALVGVLFFGQTFQGVRGWLSFGLFNFQLVELAKLVSIIALAAFWQKTVRPLPFLKIILSLIFILPPIILIIFQPDLGSALILFFIWLGIVLFIDRNPKHFIIIFIIIFLTTFLIYFFLKDYQRERLLTYFNPNYDPFGRGYQITQSIVAIGSGKFFGRGLFSGPQSQLRFLPANQTDFIFAVIAEEMGLMGCLIIFVLFFFFFLQLNTIAQKTYDNFGALLIIGVIINFFVHFIFNIGMNLGMLPIIGIPLPFLSYGGSSLIISFISIALVESVVAHRVSSSMEKEIQF